MGYDNIQNFMQSIGQESCGLFLINRKLITKNRVCIVCPPEIMTKIALRLNNSVNDRIYLIGVDFTIESYFETLLPLGSPQNNRLKVNDNGVCRRQYLLKRKNMLLSPLCGPSNLEKIIVLNKGVNSDGNTNIELRPS